MDPEKKFNRKFIRIDARLECEYKYAVGNFERNSTGTILDISGGGLKLITSMHVRGGNDIVIKATFPDGSQAGFSRSRAFYIPQKLPYLSYL